MRYRVFGSSGLRVSEVALGTMTFGEDWGWGASVDESRSIFAEFVSRGGNFIDTACNYTNGSSERIVGECIAGERHRFVVASKYTLTTDPSDPNAGGNHRKNLIRSLEGSLQRLRTEYLDVLYVHMWDGITPLEDMLRALDGVVAAGKVLHVAFSDSPAWLVARACEISARNGWARPAAIQVPYSLASRDAEREIFPMAEALGLAVATWGVLRKASCRASTFVRLTRPVACAVIRCRPHNCRSQPPSLRRRRRSVPRRRNWRFAGSWTIRPRR